MVINPKNLLSTHTISESVQISASVMNAEELWGKDTEKI